MRKSANGRRTFYLLIFSIISVIALTVVSYAWMSISTAPMVTDLALTVISDNALQLAHDNGGEPADDWSTIMDLADPTQEFSLRPVTYVASEDAFYAPSYGLDGRIHSAAGERITDENGIPLSKFAAAEDQSGYLYICDFWIRTNSSDCAVALAPPAEREDGVLGNGTFMVGEPVWDAGSVSHKNAGNGAQYAMRLALRVDPVDSLGNKDDEVFIIYEPNADGGIGLTETKSAKGDGPLQGSNLLLQQSVSSWRESVPVLRDTVLYSPGEFLTDNLSIFSLRSGHARHVTLYIWLEGQDADCTATIGDGRLLANLQFTAVAGEIDHNLRPD